MKKTVNLCFLAPLVLLLFACPLMNTSQTSPGGAQHPLVPGGSNTAGLTVQTDAIRNQGILVTGSGLKLDITTVVDDGTTVNCVDAVGVAPVADSSGGKGLSSSSVAVVIGARNDGNPGAWVYSSNKIQGVIDEDSGQVTSRLPEAGDQNGVFRGAFGWVYHVVGVSEDGKIIIGYAENKKGINRGIVQIDPGTTIGVYWRVSRHPIRPFFMVTRAHIIGTLDLSKIKAANKRIQHLIDVALRHALDQLKFLLIDYLSSYLIMVDKVHFDSVNNVYLVSGTDQDDQPAVATIDQKGGITIAETPSNTSPTFYVAGSYNSPSNIACYWNNGTKVDLDTDGNTPSFATSIFVSGGTVYVGGYYFKSGAYVGCYWTIGGTRTDLDSGTGTGAHVNSIFVSGGTVYTAGYYNNTGSNLVACYWTGATRSADMPSAGLSFANSIYVNGGTIYLSGQDNFATASYWTGGSTPAEITLPSSGTAVANSIYVSGSTVYTAGQDTVGATTVAATWTGTSSPTDLTGAGGATANSLVVVSGTTYVAGEYSSPTIACYWNSGARTDLPGVSGVAQSVYVSGTTIYTAGYYSSSPTIACYWTGTAKTDLPGTAARAASIFVQ